MTALKLRIESNGKPTQAVTLTASDGKRYYEEIPLASGFARQKFIERAGAHFDLVAADVASLDDELIAEALKVAAGGGEKIEYPAMSLAELSQAQFETKYLIPNILATAQPCVLGGPLKAMKTSVALDLAFSLATARPFLGYFHTERAARCAFMSGESSLSIVQETLLRIARAAGVDPAGVGNLIVSDKLPTFGRRDHVDAMRKFILDNELEVVCIDPAYLAIPGDNSANLMLMGTLLREMSAMFAECGAMMVLLHHFRTTRPNPHEPPDLNDLSWSGFREFAAQWLLLSRRRAYVPGTGYHELWLVSGGRMGHTGQWGVNVDEGEYQPGAVRTWDTAVLSAEEARSEAGDRDEEAREVERTVRHEKQLEADRQKVCRALAKFPGGETKNILRGFAGMSGERFTLALADLLQSDDVEPVQISKPGRRTPHDAYRLAERTTPHE